MVDLRKPWWGPAAYFQWIANEYWGWKEFKEETGVWPVFSIANIVSPPLLFFVGFLTFTGGVYRNWNNTEVFVGLVVITVACAAVVWILRNAARILDLQRAQRLHVKQFQRGKADDLIR